MNVLLIHTTPNTAMVAWPADANKLAFVTCAAVVLQNMMINPAEASMIIMIIDGICTCPEAFTAKLGVNPSMPANEGSKEGKDPSNTTSKTAIPKMTTDGMAPSLSFISRHIFHYFAKAGSFIRSMKSDLSRVLSSFQYKKHPRSPQKRCRNTLP
jgi:hypothetical protein